jgi:predicted RNase H-like HicB family nuclease
VGAPSVASAEQADWSIFVKRIRRLYELADDGGWGAYIPDLPGVVALGSTHDEVAVGTDEALSAYAEDLRERGVRLPPPHHSAGTVAA